MGRRSWSLCLVLSCALGCASAADETDAASTASPVVTPTAFTKAFGIVQGIDYLPFNYKVDGCYARALYMSMELAAQGMESNAVFAFAKQNHPLQVGSIAWGYHVAPMLEVRDANTPWAVPVHMVIDPALSNSPLTQTDWVDHMGFTPSSPATDLPTMLFVPGSDYAPNEALSDGTHKNLDTPNFSSLPPFKASDIRGACSVMYRYIGLEPGDSGETIRQKQTKLVARSTTLITALRAANKVTEDVFFWWWEDKSKICTP